ncbi:hypothetical protein HPB48_009802 [Haemaphysalis longicornis]|uniref:Uncharacterized protein n=1 Tax=Haemaphysalis longicornis TaxID=44386 RepID=A0A9J6GTG2_HAELO|nr:hypothetical protein HPB48_009802 [Haemaphysalis longicornis]
MTVIGAMRRRTEMFKTAPCSGSELVLRCQYQRSRIPTLRKSKMTVMIEDVRGLLLLTATLVAFPAAVNDWPSTGSTSDTIYPVTVMLAVANFEFDNAHAFTSRANNAGLVHPVFRDP